MFPTPKTENLYFTSINETVDQYGALLGNVQKKSLQSTGRRSR